MKTLNIRNGYVTVRLSAAQCATIARACQFASERTLTYDIDHWRTMAVLFQACAIAGYAQWQMCASDLQALEEQLYLAGLEEDEFEEVEWA